MSAPHKSDDMVDDKDLGPQFQVVTVSQSRVEEGNRDSEVDNAYLAAPAKTRFYRGVLFQMILFGALSFVGPAMSDAISNLGGGGLSTPFLANLATSLTYATSCVTTLFGGPLINKIGIKWSCVIAGFAMPLAGTGYYVRARFRVDEYLLAARAIGGVGSGFLYVAETTAMLSYPFQSERGKYLGIWSAMRSSGSVMGGAINFATNYTASGAGGIAWSTYLIFIAFECTGPFFAFLLTQTRNVRRYDGSRVPTSGSLSWGAEFKALWKHLQHKRTWLMFIPAAYSFFYGGVFGTYLSLHFSVRARALSSLIVPCITIVMVLLYGFMLDNKWMTQKQKAWFAFLAWAVPQAAGFIWTGVIYGKYGTATTTFDYALSTSDWAVAYFPYLIVFTTGYWCQLCLYWILGTFSTDVKASSRTGGLFRAFETLGQAISYGIASNTGDPRIPLYANCGMLLLTIPCMVLLIRLVPDAPAEIDDVADIVAEPAVVGAALK